MAKLGAPSWFLPWLDAERDATQLRYFEPNLIPGILAGDTPPQLVAVLAESALTCAGDYFAGILAGQIAHLITLAEHPNVHVNVVPASVGLHIGLSGPFALARSSEGRWIGHRENQLGGIVVDSDEEVATLQARWENVRNEALPRRPSIELMKEVINHHGPQ